MGIFLAIISAVSALAGPLAALIKDAFGLYDAETTASGTDPDTLASDAKGAAQAACDLLTDTEQQIALVKKTLAGQHPALSVPNLTQLAAHAVAAEAASRAKATKVP